MLSRRFRAEGVLAAVNVRPEDDGVFRDLTQVLKAEALKAAAVGEGRAVPLHEAVQPAEVFHDVHTGTQVEVVCVGKNDVRADALQV